jgi:membrane peptidoglycan carboxypeptidase
MISTATNTTQTQGKLLTLSTERIVLMTYVSLTLWSLWVWLTFPSSEPFPYEMQSLCLGVGIMGTFAVGRKIISPRAKYTLLAPIPLLVVSFLGLFVWAEGEVEALPTVVATQDQRNVLSNMTVAMEDGYFYQHRGFDFEAMHRALRRNIRAGKVMQGGSTITQQAAKNLFLGKERTLGRKIPEFFLAMALERRFTKSQILVLYMKNIEYGMEQKGVESASQYYFGKTVGQLTLSESALLVSLVPSNPKQMPSEEKLIQGREVALGRLQYFFPNAYSDAQIEAARQVPMEKVLPRWFGQQQRKAGTL